MKPLTDPVEMLDTVLRWFSMDVSEMSLGALIPRGAAPKQLALKNMVEVFPELNSPEFLIYSDLILDKLVQDGYIVKDWGQVLDLSVGEFYSITFDGKLYSKYGGYAQDAICKDERKRWEDALLIKGERGTVNGSIS